jgi:phage major head subunit gpT-like protein
VAQIKTKVYVPNQAVYCPEVDTLGRKAAFKMDEITLFILNP